MDEFRIFMMSGTWPASFVFALLIAGIGLLGAAIGLTLCILYELTLGILYDWYKEGRK